MTELVSNAAVEAAVSAAAAYSPKKADGADPAPKSAGGETKKRPAEESSTPSMTKPAAAKAMKSLKVPKKPKNQSLYVRFKSLLLKDAKERGDTETSGNITKVAKEAFAKVKNMTPPAPVDPANTSSNETSSSSAASSSSNLSDDIQRYLQIKGRAIKAEKDEAIASKAETKKFCQDFATAATSYLQWATIEATEENASTLKDAINTVTTKLNQVMWDTSVDITPLKAALKEAQDQHRIFADAIAERTLLDKLRNGSEQDLINHVKEHRNAQREIEELKAIKNKYDTIQVKQQAEEERRREAEEREVSKAYKIESEITSSLKKQMVYTNSSLRYSSKTISYKRGGVTEKVFAAAFNVAVGTKKATISGYLVGTKDLRYGGWLSCSDVNVRLSGEELIATAKYTMQKC